MHPPIASLKFVSEAVESGATILTDAWKGYNDLEKRGYKHIKITLSDSGDPAHIVMPVHNKARYSECDLLPSGWARSLPGRRS